MRKLLVVMLVLAIAFVGLNSDKPTSAVSGGTLFAGTDEEDFAASPLPDRLAVMTTSGGSVTANVIKNGQVYLNGLASTGAGKLYSGDAVSNKHNVLDYNGNLVSTITGPLPGNVPSQANEDLAFDGANVWRAHWPGGPLFQYNPGTGSAVNQYAQADVVGAEFVCNTLWISKYNGQQVGTFDPVTNTFTQKFTTAGKAGGLAYDAGNKIMWVGGFGTVEAWDLSGSPTLIAGSAFSPLGPDFIDGLAFVPSAATPTPSPCPVGGTVTLAAAADSSSAIPWILVAGLGALAVPAAGFWFSRRRWFR